MDNNQKEVLRTKSQNSKYKKQINYKFKKTKEENKKCN